MANLWVKETWVNRDDKCLLGESDVYETYTEEKGQLYRHMVREYGRCIGKIYVETKEGTKEVGWVFLKRQKYSDCKETYLQETWVTVHTGPPEKTIKYQYA